MRIELLVAPDCPHASATRMMLAACIDQVGLGTAVLERVGDYPSPTVLIDGINVMTGAPGAPQVQACRRDVPDAPRVLAALRGQAAPPTRPAAS
jgi:hypothetical protein